MNTGERPTRKRHGGATFHLDGTVSYRSLAEGRWVRVETDAIPVDDLHVGFSAGERLERHGPHPLWGDPGQQPRRALPDRPPAAAGREGSPLARLRGPRPQSRPQAPATGSRPQGVAPARPEQPARGPRFRSLAYRQSRGRPLAASPCAARLARPDARRPGQRGGDAVVGPGAGHRPRGPLETLSR